MGWTWQAAEQLGARSRYNLGLALGSCIRRKCSSSMGWNLEVIWLRKELAKHLLASLDAYKRLKSYHSPPLLTLYLEARLLSATPYDVLSWNVYFINSPPQNRCKGHGVAGWPESLEARAPRIRSELGRTHPPTTLPHFQLKAEDGIDNVRAYSCRLVPRSLNVIRKHIVRTHLCCPKQWLPAVQLCLLAEAVVPCCSICWKVKRTG